jgi:hypothetical protein
VPLPQLQAALKQKQIRNSLWSNRKPHANTSYTKKLAKKGAAMYS